MLYYEAVDPQPFPNIVSYYRLKQVDTDGSFEYSNVVAVNVLTTSPNVPYIFPNPGSGDVTVSLSGPQGGPQLFEVLDLSGRVMLTEMHQAMEGEVIELSTAALPAGTYLIRVSGGDSQPVSARWIKD